MARQAQAAKPSTRPIGTWVAAGLSLAVIGFATQFGVFTVSAAVLLAPMVYVFARLRGHAPDARTTSDFVGAVLGERFGVFAGLVQLVAYLLLAVKFARTLAVGLLGTLRVPRCRTEPGLAQLRRCLRSARSLRWWLQG